MSHDWTAHHSRTQMLGISSKTCLMKLLLRQSLMVNRYFNASLHVNFIIGKQLLRVYPFKNRGLSRMVNMVSFRP